MKDLVAREQVAANLRAVAVALAGGVAFDLLGVPGAYLSGAILASAALALAGVHGLAIAQPVRSAALLVLGIVVGTTVTDDTLASLPQWPASLGALAVAMAGLMVMLPRYFTRVHAIDPATAKLCAIPGALSVVMALADELDVDERRVAVLQSLRLAILMMMVPLMVSAGLGGVAPRPSAPPLPWHLLVMLFASSGLGALAARKLAMPAPFLIGPLIVSGILFGSGTLQGSLPGPLTAGAFLVMGASVGGRFAGIDRAYLASCVSASAGGISIAVALTAAVAWPVAAWLGIPFIQMWLAIAPGGLDTMIALALALGVDPAFVAGHQFVRLIGLFVLVPFLFRGAARG